ncbi:Protein STRICTOSIDINE SYNTHASE-LIKE 10 [Linum perenne]
MDSISSKQLLFIFIFISLISNLGSILCDIANYTLAQFALPPGVVGPESLAFDCNGEGPYVGVSDGRILKWNPGRQTQWIEFAVAPYRDRAACDGKSDPSLEPKCGRPLGLKFNPKTCDLYIADAYFGLMATGPDGGLAVKLVSSSSDGVPFKFTNGLDVDPVTDNIRRSLTGNNHFWVGLNTGTVKVNGEDDDLLPDPVAMKLNDHGEILETVDDDGGDDLNSVSEVAENGNGGLWFGSVTKDYIGFIPKW